VTPVVLVHGGSFAASCWDLLVPLVDGPVLAVDLPGRGAHPAPLESVTLSMGAESLVADIDAAGYDDVVLVGHSMAGCVLPGAIGLLGDRVRHAVFVACTVPSHGSTALDMLDPGIRAMAEEALASGSAGGTLDPEIARVVFANDMDDEQFGWMAERMVPEAPGVITEPVDLTPLRSGRFGRTWVRPVHDAIVAPADQLVFAGHVGDCEVVDLEAAHMCMISQPAALAAIIRPIAVAS
jgi:pimeloyl-ACP methyl ester carboxylesterase